MKKQFTLNLGLIEYDYVASNERIEGITPILVVSKDLANNEGGESKIHHLSVLSAVPSEVLEAATKEQPLIYIYNDKDFKNGFIN